MPGESGLSRGFRDLRRLGWECEFKTDRIWSDKPFLFQSRSEWDRYRKIGSTYLQHNGEPRDIHTALSVLRKYCSSVVWDEYEQTIQITR